jgi:hypothetical protein
VAADRVMLHVPFLTLWVLTLMDIVGRADLSGPGKALWSFAVLLLPLISIFVYFCARPKDLRDMSYSPSAPSSANRYPTSNAADTMREFEAFVEMHERGAITDTEFTRLKNQLVAAR